jgi:hypothetical protein
MQNQDEFILLNAVEGDIVACRKTAQAGAQVLVSRPSDIRASGQQPETLGDVVHGAGRNIS